MKQPLSLQFPETLGFLLETQSLDDEHELTLLQGERNKTVKSKYLQQEKSKARSSPAFRANGF